MNKALLFLFLSLCCTTLLLAQTKTGSIEGLVTDNDNEPLVGMNVALQGTSLGNITDTEGEFSITRVPAGQYELVVSGVGYQTQRRTVEVSANETLRLEFFLQPSLTQLQDIEIIGRKETSYQNDVSFVATKTATPLQDVPQAISYVTKEIIQDQQAFRTGDIVKNISGVNQFSFYDDFTLRGFRSNSGNAKMINGLRSVGIFGPQPLLANMERVEVIKGPASALFANANPGGTINYVTKKPLDEERKSVGFTVGSFNTLRATADFTGPMNESGTLLYRLNLAYEDTDTFRDLQQTTNYIIAPSISFLPTDKTSVNFDLVINRSQGKLDRGQPIFGATADTDIYDTPISLALAQPNDYHNNNIQYFTLSLNHEFTRKLSFNASYMRFSWNEDLYEHRTSNRFAVDSLGQQLPTLMEMQTINRIRKQVSDNLTAYFVLNENTGPLQHQLLAGFDYIQQEQPLGGAQAIAGGYRTADGGAAPGYNPAQPDRFLFNNGVPVPNIPHFDLQNPNYTIAYPHQYIVNSNRPQPATRYYTFGFYLQDQISFGKFKALLSLRQENYRDVEGYKTDEEEVVKQDKLLPRLGLVYELNSRINLYGTYTESFQPQTPSVITDPNVGGPFDPLSANMWEVGAKSLFFNGQFSANLALYQIEQNNILVNANDPGNPDLLEQRGQERARGVELDITGNPLPNLSLNVNYAFNRALITESDDENEVGRIKENAPEHQGGIWAKYTFSNRALNGLGIALGSNFVTERNTFDTFREVNGQMLGLTLPSYVIFDAAVSYRVNRFNIAANFYNLLDETHWVGGYSYVRLFPGAPRNFLLSVGYTF
ncbi:MAG: TonB-dependent siderophore receptor [Cyclobacteriaceae bacterium]